MLSSGAYVSADTLRVPQLTHAQKYSHTARHTLTCTQGPGLQPPSPTNDRPIPNQ